MTDEVGPTRFEKRPRVLCVDDEPVVLDSLRRQLYAQFAIVGVETGAEALALLSQDSSFSVLMSDMRMPGMDGYVSSGSVPVPTVPVPTVPGDDGENSPVL
jgi:DNA-binding NtrC family response regulator